MLDEKLQKMLMGMALAELSMAQDSSISGHVLLDTVHDLSWTMLALRVTRVVRQHQDPVHCAEDIWNTVQTVFTGNSIPDDVWMYPIWTFPVGCLIQNISDMRTIAVDLASIAELDPDFVFAMMLLAHGSTRDMPISEMLKLLHTELSDRYEPNLLRVGHVLTWGSEQYALNHLLTPAGIGAVLAQSLYMLFRYAPDYAAIIEHSLRAKAAPRVISMMTGWVTCGLGAAPGIDNWQADQLFRSIRDELAAG